MDLPPSFFKRDVITIFQLKLVVFISGVLLFSTLFSLRNFSVLGYYMHSHKCKSKKDQSCSRVTWAFIVSQQMPEGYMNNNSNNTSQPATPGGALPVPSPLSPSPASLSSYHGDDSDSISSPPWPLKAPCSPVRMRDTQLKAGIACVF